MNRSLDELVSEKDSETVLRTILSNESLVKSFSLTLEHSCDKDKKIYILLMKS